MSTSPERRRGIRPAAGRAFLGGTLIASCAAAAAWLVARYGFGRIWYLAPLLAVATVSCLLVAWFSYLRDDGLVRRGRSAGGTGDRGGAADVPAARAEGPGSGADASDAADAGSRGSGSVRPGGTPDGRPDTALFAAMAGGIIPRAPRPGEDDARDPGPTRRSFLVAAAELALLSAALYRFAGVGARFFGKS